MQPVLVMHVTSITSIADQYWLLFPPYSFPFCSGIRWGYSPSKIGERSQVLCALLSALRRFFAAILYLYRPFPL